MTQHPVDSYVLTSSMEHILRGLVRRTPWDNPYTCRQVKVILEKMKVALMDQDCPASAKFGFGLFEGFLKLLQCNCDKVEISSGPN